MKIIGFKRYTYLNNNIGFSTFKFPKIIWLRQIRMLRRTYFFSLILYPSLVKMHFYLGQTPFKANHYDLSEFAFIFCICDLTTYLKLTIIYISISNKMAKKLYCEIMPILRIFLKSINLQTWRQLSFLCYFRELHFLSLEVQQPL